MPGMLCEVDRSFIEDSFNLYGLRHLFPNFQESFKIILDKTAAEQCKDPKVAQNAFMLYGLIHARFIITPRGLDVMLRKFRLSEFGKCPRVLCQEQSALPVGFSDEPGRATVKLYCPRCYEVYEPAPNSEGDEQLDGAFFGTTFAHMFLMTFDRYVNDFFDNSYVYTPRIFGFKIHKSAPCMQRRMANFSQSFKPLNSVCSHKKGELCAQKNISSIASSHNESTVSPNQNDQKFSDKNYSENDATISNENVEAQKTPSQNDSKFNELGEARVNNENLNDPINGNIFEKGNFEETSSVLSNDKKAVICQVDDLVSRSFKNGLAEPLPSVQRLTQPLKQKLEKVIEHEPERKKKPRNK